MPIKGNDLVTDSQAASAVNGGNTQRQGTDAGQLVGDRAMERQLIVDPHTGLLLADQEIVIKAGTNEAWAKPGWRWTYSARLDDGWTDADPAMPTTNCALPSAPPVCR